MATGLFLGDDPWLARRLARLGAELGLEFSAGPVGVQPRVVVIDLGGDGALARVGELRSRWPKAVVAGYLAVPDHDRWVAAQRAGCDLVANRGALVARLRGVLTSGVAERTFPVLSEADAAGRLGLVARVAETPIGPVALFHVDGRLHAISDRCPHAGAVLSEGELDHRTLTCPRHGSRFDVTTGERVRGPADVDVRSVRVVVENGQIAIVVDDG
ncbi:MAG: Rieske 2Fe-2S domain-containing protein [Actinomycetia bacterium]|nr:Rieske 2Fe-2S domain-containing protein [Actinomycetes bacterium]